jgi:pimeloyl-ACP methyl ester carboxylesterase
LTDVPAGIAPFTLHVPQRGLDDLRDRLARTRWLDEFPGAGWAYGTSRVYLEELCRYWREDFDWRACEARLNAFGQVMTDVDGQPIHAIHARSPEPGALPLLLVHGWPGSVFEFEKVIEPLRDPVRHGGRAADAFHVVCPSIPGYGFSGPTVGPGWNVRRISAAFALLMHRLGYQRYGAAGGDWGAIITTDLVRSAAGAGVCGLYLTMPEGEPPEGSGDPEAGLTDPERQGLRDWAAHQAAGTVIHLPLNTTRPHTLAFAVNDSPAGLAAWLVEMFRSFSDCDGDVERRFTKDELLANVTTYWLTGTIASAARLYAEWAEQKRTFPRPPRVQVPTGCAIYPRDVRRVPRSWAERLYPITRWTDMPAGGHFPSMEEPGLFVADLAAFFRRCRLGGWFSRGRLGGWFSRGRLGGRLGRGREQRGERLRHLGPAVRGVQRRVEVGVDDDRVDSRGSGPRDLGTEFVHALRAQVRDLNRRRGEQAAVQLKWFSSGGAHLVELTEHLQVLLERTGGRVPDIELFRGTPQPGGRAHPGQQPRPGLLDRLGTDLGLGDREEAAAERHRVRSPAGEQRVDELVAADAAGPRVDVHDLVLFVGPADAEAGHQPPAGQQIDGGQLLGQRDRPVQSGHQDAGPDHRADGPGRRCGQRHESGQRTAVGVRDLEARTGRVTRDRMQWIKDVLLHPQAAVAELLRPFAEGTQAMTVDVAAELRQAQADVHIGLPLTL